MALVSVGPDLDNVPMSDDAGTQSPPPARSVVGGSDRAALPGDPLGGLPAQEQIEATLVLRRRAPLPDGLRLTAQELADGYGADPADVQTVTDTLTAHGIQVLESDAASRRVRIAGSVADLTAFFDTDLQRMPALDAQDRPIEVRGRAGQLTVPAALGDMVSAVLGLDNRPQTRTRLRYASAAATTSYTPLQLATIYDLPSSSGGTTLDGSGQTIAIIELGGGFGQSDLDTYFGGLGLATPTVTAVGVDGAANAPGQDPQGADGEVLLDIEVAGALAPKAHVVVYFAPNTDAGFLDAVTQAAHASPTPCAMSISWGQSEDDWTAQARTAMDAAFADACALGVTVTVAAGDDGSTDRATDGKAHCDFPASSPHVLGCGGTKLVADPTTGKLTSETVWNEGAGAGATGGGVSDAFPVPTWQAHVGVPSGSGSGGRGVPDVAAVADPSTGYRVYVDGQAAVIGGTSAVAPLWAGLLARLSQAAGTSFGLLQPTLYGTTAAGAVAPGFRDITVGDNGAYRAGPGWDACTGLGVPVGSALLEVLKAT